MFRCVVRRERQDDDDYSDKDLGMMFVTPLTYLLRFNGLAIVLLPS